MHLNYTYFDFKKLKFSFSIFDDYEKKGDFLLSPSQELAGLPFSLCAWCSIVNQFTIGSLGGKQKILCARSDLFNSHWECLLELHVTHWVGKLPLPPLQRWEICKEEIEKTRAPISSAGFMWEAQRMWAILQPLAQNSSLMAHNFMCLSCSPVSSFTQNLNTWTKHFQQVSTQMLCACLRPHCVHWSQHSAKAPQTSLHVVSVCCRPRFGQHRTPYP